MRYRPEIDGLRAIAVLPVILFHAHVPGFGGGFIGVDIFFVISGYLITSILLFDLAEGRFSLWRFYERRARRILPALFVVIAVTSFFAYRWMLPHDLWAYGRSVAATSLFASNVLFWTEAGYFATASELKPMLHTWSLAIEEQFYIVFPILLWGLWRLGGRRSGLAIAVMAILALMSLGWAEWGSSDQSARFFLPFARAWELLVGALCAVALRNGAVVGSPLLAALSAVLLLAGFGLIDARTAWPSLMTLLPVLGTAGIILWARPGAGVGTLLSARSLVAIGLVSYSAYLWHHPIYALARLRLIEVTPGWTVALFVLTFVLAWATWVWIETPFRKRGANARFSALFVSISAPTSMLYAAVLGLYLFSIGYQESRGAVASRPFAELRLSERLTLSLGLNRNCSLVHGGLPEKCQAGQGPEMVFWGDSYVRHLLNDPSTAEIGGGVVQIVEDGCPPITGLAPATASGLYARSRLCLKQNDLAAQWIAERAAGIDIVVLSSRFVMLERRAATRDIVFGAGSTLRATEMAMRRTLDNLRSMGVRPVVVSALPTTGENFGRCNAKRLQFGFEDELCNFTLADIDDATRARNNLLMALSEDVPIIWLDRWLCPEGRCSTVKQGHFVYRDHDHFSRDATWLRQNDLKLFDKIREAADGFYGERISK